MIYGSLEGLSIIPQVEAHEQAFKQSKGGYHGSFGDVGGGDRYLMITFNNVDFAEDGAAVQVVDQVLDVWEGVPVRGCDCVEAMVVATWLPEAILFGHHVYRGCLGGV